MSRRDPWERRDWYKSTPKKPPPEHGIKMKKAGTTWWGQRWIEALEHVLRGDSNRLARGRTYARAGRTHDLIVKEGKVTAKVTGSRSTPYKITIQLAQLDEAQWTAATAGMAAKARFCAELLAGQMPNEIDDVFREVGTSLFPQERTDLQTSCTCPDWGDPCKHVAATHYVLGEAFDRDPFLLFELRGKTKDSVLDALRRSRGADEAPARAKRRTKVGGTADPQDQQDLIPKVALRKLQASDYDTLRDSLPSLNFAFDEPITHGAVLRQLGTPAAWTSSDTPADVLAPLLRAAAETARRIALGEAPAAEDPAPEVQVSSVPRAKSRARDEGKASGRTGTAGRAAAGATADAVVQRLRDELESLGVVERVRTTRRGRTRHR